MNIVVIFTVSIIEDASIHSGIIRAGLMIITIPVLMMSVYKERVLYSIIIALSYFLLLVITNERIQPAMGIWVSVAISLLMYPVTYRYIYKKCHYNWIYNISIILLLIIGVHFIFAQFFNIGRVPYRMNIDIHTGWGDVHQTFNIVYLLLFMPFLHYILNKGVSKIQIIIYFISLIPIILIFRRGAVLGLMLGFLVYIILTPYKGKLVLFLLGLFFIMVISSPLYFDRLEIVLEQRPTDYSDFVETGRTLEFTWLADIYKNSDVSFILFGAELFDYPNFANVRRPLHTDYVTYLLGGGIIGFLLYLNIFISIWIQFLRNIKNIKKTSLRRELIALFAAITAANIIISYSGQYYVISSLTCLMMYYAMISRYAMEVSNNKIQ
ncbi:O-antigen ligase family protein [Balneolales bacterium ANBcel1]|nr:O-antigen ligase family protein [Balneolales bacterium ANBcel1]